MNRPLSKLQAFSGFPDLAYFNMSPYYNLSQKETDRMMLVYAQCMTVIVVLERETQIGGWNVEEKMLNCT